MRLYAQNKTKAIKVKKTDGTLATIADVEVEDFLAAWGDRDDLIYDDYEIAIDDINDATDWAAVAAAIATFEAS
jgi:hypothetical protein